MDNQPEAPAVTILLNDRRPASERIQDLLPQVYRQLRACAQNCLAAERPGHTLQATALVHEAYLKLIGPREIPWRNRAHFYAAAAEAMRRILIDHARARAATIRGGGRGSGEGGPGGERVAEGNQCGLAARLAAVSLSGLPDPSSGAQCAGFLILDEAVSRLESVDQEAATVVRFRYFAGLSIDQTASALGASPATVKRSWAFARGWLKEAIEAGRVEARMVELS
ncbi:MAG: RNA polymerase subunit sigma-70 [Phycisphaerae bacterium]|nr:RNA polymerase subunit sigma-70 [Phycisphaerae bacterium]